MAPNPYRLEFKLKQHTPIIHFQHRQAGATLRATEMKPKLDRFIIESLLISEGLKPGDGYNEYRDETKLNGEKVKVFYDERKAFWFLASSSKPEWLNLLVDTSDNKHISLNYKLKILQGKSKAIGIPYSSTKDGMFRPSYPNIFGNVESKEQCKYLLFSEDIDLSIFTISNFLLEEIRTCLSAFFTRENFGFRQSKGFGSYTLEENRSFKRLSKYCFYVDVSNEANSERKIKLLFQTIELFYKTLRSGINQKNKNETTKNFDDVYYFKSLMFLWAKSQNEQWDKRTIRENYMLYPNSFYEKIKKNRTSQNGTVNYSNENNNGLYRDLLGLSTEQSWLRYDDTITKQHEEEKISRFKSPLTFKPIKINNDTFLVHIFFNEIPSTFLGQGFNVLSKKENPKVDGNQLKLYIPDSFSLNTFLNFIITTFSDNGAFNEDKFDKYIDITDFQKADNAVTMLTETFKSLVENYYHP